MICIKKQRSFKCVVFLRFFTLRIEDYLYTNAFTLYRYGYANAVGVVLAIIIALFSVLQFKTMNTGVEY